MPPETRSQDARKGDEANNLEHTQAYDQIQQQLNDTRADTNISFRELKEVLDALVFRVDSVLQNTKLSAPTHTRRPSKQLHLSTLLRRTSQPSSMEPVKVHLPIIPYVDQNENSLFLRGMMYLNGFINAINILMWKRLLSMISSNWPLTIWMEWLCVGTKIS
jgi:hypothetical protein